MNLDDEATTALRTLLQRGERVTAKRAAAMGIDRLNARAAFLERCGYQIRSDYGADGWFVAMPSREAAAETERVVRQRNGPRKDVQPALPETPNPATLAQNP